MPKKKQEEKYHITKWNALDNYECVFCPHATLSLETAERHWDTRHAPPLPIKRAVAVPVYDRFGNLVTEIEEKE